MILLISAVFPPEPVVSANISAGLAEKLSNKFSVTVLRPKPTRPFGFRLVNCSNANLNYKVIELASFTYPKLGFYGRFKESLSMGIYCSKYITQNRDSINLIYNGAWPLFGQFLISKTAKKYGIPVISPVQDLYPESLMNKLPFLKKIFKFILLPIDKYVLQNSNKIVANSGKMKDYLARSRKIDLDKIEIVQNWQNEETYIDYELSLNLTHTGNKPFTFMYLGNIGPVAGIDLLIEAFSKADLKNCRLVIAGAGSIKNFLQEKVTLKGLSNIEFWNVPDGKVPEIQAQADVMLLPIKKGAASSSIPSKLSAYMFSKKPIVACVDGNSETASAIITANCGWVIMPEEIELLANNMKYIASINPNELETKGLNGFNYALENLTKEKNLKKLVSIFNECLKFDYLKNN